MSSIVKLEGGQFVISEKKKAEDIKSWLLLVALYPTILFIIRSNLYSFRQNNNDEKNDFKWEKTFF